MKHGTATPEKMVKDLLGTIDALKAEIESLKDQRKDLKRFMDIDKEKEELEFLRAEKDKLLATASKEAEAIKEAARKSADRVMENGNENAKIIADEARKIKTDNERRAAELDELSQKLSNEQYSLKRLETLAVEREKLLVLREDRIKVFVERMQEALASL